MDMHESKENKSLVKKQPNGKIEAMQKAMQEKMQIARPAVVAGSLPERSVRWF